TGQIALPEKRHGLELDQVDTGGSESEGAVVGLTRFRVSPQEVEHFADSSLRFGKSGIEALRLLEMSERRIEAPEALLGERQSAHQGRIAGRNAQPLLVLLEGAAVIQ